MLLKLATSSAVVMLRAKCPNCFRIQSYATRKRFYKNTNIIQNDTKWEVTLDHRRLKTPNGQPLLIPSEPLARAIAAEWDSQIETISQPTMHLTALCNTALDNPAKLKSHDIANYLIDYVATDTLLFYSDEEEDLRKLQQQKWGPVIDWFEERFNVKQEVSSDLQPPPVNAETRAALARHFLSYDFPSLNGVGLCLVPLHQLIDWAHERFQCIELGPRTQTKVLPKAMVFGVEALKSPLLMLACVERRLEPKQAVMLSRLEEEYQLTRWGRVPWAHGLNQAELTARVAAALLAVHCGSERHSTKAKAKADELSAQ